MAYDNAPLSIGRGQTISQPLVVALMSEALSIGSRRPGAGDRDGVGLPRRRCWRSWAPEVFSVEIIPHARGLGGPRILRSAGYRDVELHTADGFFGWDEHSPYDAIIVTAAANKIPAATGPAVT